MRKFLTGLVAAATIAGAMVATSGTAEARWHGRGWGPGAVIGGLAAGAILGGVIASQPYYPYGGYYGPGPYYGPGCAWRTVWNGYRWVRACY